MAVSLSLMHCCCPCPSTAPAAAAAAGAGAARGATALQQRGATTTAKAAARIETHLNTGSSRCSTSSSSSSSGNSSSSNRSCLPKCSISTAGSHRVSCSNSSSVRVSFTGGADRRRLNAAVWSVPRAPKQERGCGSTRPVVTMAKPVIQFIRGINEQSVPDVKLTRSRDGSNGVASFVFDQPSVFDQSREMGDITGIYMIDDEGVLSSVDVSAKFINGKPAKIEARYVMRNLREWDRFMRFMERYANENELGFVKS